jgi:hypothetical protein
MHDRTYRDAWLAKRVDILCVAGAALCLALAMLAFGAAS